MTASILHDMEWVLPLRHDALTPVFKAFTTLGYTEFFFASLPVLYWCWNKDSANRVAILTLLAGMLTLFLKDWFQDPRPPAELAVEGTRPDSYGLPSGHTLMAIVFWGSLAFESGKRWVLFTASVMVVGITTSRLYLAVHDIEDVLAGAIIGSLLLGILIFKQRRCPRCGEGWAWSLLLMAIPIALLLAWPQGGSAVKMTLVSGFLAGWIIGKNVEPRVLEFLNPNGWKRTACALAGFAILMLMAYFLRTILFNLEIPGVANPVIGGLIIGLGSTLIVPWFLVRLKLLQRSKS